MSKYPELTSWMQEYKDVDEVVAATLKIIEGELESLEQDLLFKVYDWLKVVHYASNERGFFDSYPADLPATLVKEIAGLLTVVEGKLDMDAYLAKRFPTQQAGKPGIFITKKNRKRLN